MQVRVNVDGSSLKEKLTTIIGSFTSSLYYGVEQAVENETLLEYLLKYIYRFVINIKINPSCPSQLYFITIKRHSRLYASMPIFWTSVEPRIFNFLSISYSFYNNKIVIPWYNYIPQELRGNPVQSSIDTVNSVHYEH